MKMVPVNQIIILFVFISCAVAQEIKTAVPDEKNVFKMECKNDSNITFVANTSLWTSSFDANCPNRSVWSSFLVGLGIVVQCHNKPNCSLDLTNVTITNCTDYRNYLNVKYTCKITATTTEMTTTTESDGDDDSSKEKSTTTTTESVDDDDNSEEKSTTSTTTTTTTKKPGGGVEPHYLLQPVPGLLTTPKPTRRPYNYPVPLIPVPAPRPMPELPPLFGPFNRPPIFDHYKGGGFNAPPIFMPIPLPAPIPIPVFG